MLNQGSVLNGDEIVETRKNGGIIIEPFYKECVNSSSYDVTLGNYFYREKPIYEGRSDGIYNPYSDKEVDKVWKGPFEAEIYKGNDLNGIVSGYDKIIYLHPHETILSHTQEFIGGVSEYTTMIKARSSIGRNFIEICKCAGWGDIGFYNRWTLEITNNSNYRIPLVVGRKIGQIIFIPVTKIDNKDAYHQNGKYQNEVDLKKMKQNWMPQMMLPQMYKDKTIFQL